MGKYSIIFSENTIRELEKHKKVGNKAINTKIDKIFNELKYTPFTGLWSRRINREHRRVYSVEEDIVTVFVVSAMGHYSDK